MSRRPQDTGPPSLGPADLWLSLIHILAICLFFFAFSTVLGWNLFGKINVIYLFGKKSPKLCTTIYTVVALIFIFLGTTMSNDLVCCLLYTSRCV